MIWGEVPAFLIDTRQRDGSHTYMITLRVISSVCWIVDCTARVGSSVA